VFFGHVSMAKLHCPHCNKVVDSLPLGICSWLGPELYRCGHCGSSYNSGRLEWVDMTLRRKAWYVLVSFLYVGAVGGMGGVSVAGCVQFLKDGPWQKELPVGTLEQGLGTLACALLIAVVQVGRVFRSVQRTNEREQLFADLECNPELDVSAIGTAHNPAFWLGPWGLALFLVFVPALSGWLVALVVKA
jgi:hypothetical protein